LKPRLFADAARQRLQCLPVGVETPAVLQAKVDFFEALVNGNAAEAKRAFAVLEPSARRAPRLGPAAQARQDQRTGALGMLLRGLRDRREAEARGVVYPPPTPEQEAESRVVMDRFTRWLAGDDSAGPFE
jgi:hypothetical protein